MKVERSLTCYSCPMKLSSNPPPIKLCHNKNVASKNSIHITMAMVQFTTDNLQSVPVWWVWLPAQMCADVRESQVIIQNMTVDNYR